ncbi:MAG: endonuclease III [Gemmatimonadales bacterium]
MAKGTRGGQAGRRAGGRKAPRKPAGRRGRPALAPAKERAPIIFRRLSKEYPGARCALDHENPYQLLVATILSAQCTDVRVNLVTPALFRRYPTPFELAHADQAALEDMIRSTGFFRNKTRSLLGMAQAVVAEHGGEIPSTMEELTALPGVGRKTANVVLGNAFGINGGVVVDTHVTRLSRLLGLTRQGQAEKIEQDLMQLFPRKQWTLLSHLLILHGRAVCIARRPKCGDCVLSDVCPSSTV